MGLLFFDVGSPPIRDMLFFEQGESFDGHLVQLTGKAADERGMPIHRRRERDPRE
jgi:hypothetical protein